MASGYGKKSFGDKVKGGLRRVFTFAVLGGVFVGAPAYYEYGTVKTEEVKIKEVKSEWDHYDSKKGEAVYNYQLITDKGQVIGNKNSLMHFKFNSKDIQDQVNDGRDSYNSSNSSSSSPWSIFNGASDNSDQPKKDPTLDPSGKTWRIEYYGARIDVPFIHTYPNVLSVTEVTKDELAARAKAQQQARHDQQAQVKKDQANGQPQPGQTTAAPAGALSGTTITFDTVVDGERVTITAPIEAAGKVQVNKVAPLVPPKGPGS